MPDSDFGYTVWGRDWVRLAESLRQTQPNPLLPRARRIARDGGAQITIDGPIVRASVQQGRNTWRVTLEVAPMSVRTAAEISRRLSGGQPALTEELHREITRVGHSPAPNLVHIDCPCPAEFPRCVHVLAVYYEMGRLVDDDPRIALEIQGFFRAASTGAHPPAKAAAQRWIALNALKPADYFM